MSNASSASCATALLSGWISRFGSLAHITSDRGTSLTSQLWMSLGQLLGTTIHHTTAYNPEANSMVELFHRTLKAALMSRCSNIMWFSQLPWVLGLRTTPKEGLDVSSVELVFGDPLVVPGEFPVLHPAMTSPDYDASSGSSPPENRPTGHLNTITFPKIYIR
ncbi:uncharacterized protein LOC119572013 [Penaeus monodon]|uniref:uncharacterized protein LOC119572013 n=1 Tax=Penaeus monodon TaxID=6687 RepID=UPI0018A6E987|nr:uncharacterized protein LOC119572013 [Penaeus monodon]